LYLVGDLFEKAYVLRRSFAKSEENCKKPGRNLIYIIKLSIAFTELITIKMGGNSVYLLINVRLERFTSTRNHACSIMFGN